MSRSYKTVYSFKPGDLVRKKSDRPRSPHRAGVGLVLMAITSWPGLYKIQWSGDYGTLWADWSTLKPVAEHK